MPAGKLLLGFKSKFDSPCFCSSLSRSIALWMNWFIFLPCRGPHFRFYASYLTLSHHLYSWFVEWHSFKNQIEFATPTSRVKHYQYFSWCLTQSILIFCSSFFVPPLYTAESPSFHFLTRYRLTCVIVFVKFHHRSQINNANSIQIN